MKAKFFIFSICLLAIFSFGFVYQNPQTGTVRDIDGNIYKIIKIGDQWWMAENLRVTRDPEGSPITGYFYKDDSQQFGKYGRLYTWQTAMNGSEKENAQGISPDGWHIPSIADWEELIRYLGGVEKVAEQISVGGPTGFDAYLSGGADFRGNYVYFNKYAMFWTSTATSEERAYHVGISDEKKWDQFAAMKGARINIRCVKNKN